MNSIIINLDDDIDMNMVYNHIRGLYPDFKIVKKQKLKNKITWDKFEKYCGIVRPNINEKLELEESRRERYESVD